MTFALLRFLQFLLARNAGINLPLLDLSIDPLALDNIPTKCTMVDQLMKHGGHWPATRTGPGWRGS